MDYAFHCYNSMAETGIMLSLKRLLGELKAPPVLLCVGSDLALGDSLGPICGTLLAKKRAMGYLYGTLKTPVTAKEMKYVEGFLKRTHPNSKIIAIDAALGEDSDVGLIKISNAPLSPGAGAKKKLGKIGDVSILGIVSRKSCFSYSSLNLTRLNLVYTLADVIANGVEFYLSNEQNEPSRHTAL